MTSFLDMPVALSEGGVACKICNILPADMTVNASGCRFYANACLLQHPNFHKLAYKYKVRLDCLDERIDVHKLLLLCVSLMS